MIISHEHQYIFFKPTKVAGTSIEIALAEHCGEQDIITSISNFNPEIDESEYEQIPQNDSGFYTHMTPSEIRRRIGRNLWRNYSKITIERNPWDLVVSRWYWKQYDTSNPKLFPPPKNISRRFFETLGSKEITLERILKSLKYRLRFNKIRNQIIEDNFTGFVIHYPRIWTNNDYYFDILGRPYFDRIIRFDHLQKDYDTICLELGFPTTNLPRAKTKVRKDDRHYSTFYNDKAKEHIMTLFSRQIELFDHSFEIHN